MLKFQRNYICQLEIGTMNVGDYGHPNIEEIIHINYPITMNFNIQRKIGSESNTANIQFLNINPEYRTKLWKDSFNNKKYIGITLFAGYGNTMPLIFKGYVTACYSYKQGGDVDFITELQATDVGYLLQYGFCNMTVAKGAGLENITKTMMEGIPEIQIGYLTDEFKNKKIKRDTTYIGQPFDLLVKDHSKFQVFVDNGNLHVLSERDVIPGEVYAITANSGLLGSPKRNDTLVEADILFEPGLKVGQSVSLLSDSIEGLNGTYKILGLSHRGIISARQTGRVVTSVTLTKGDGVLNQLQDMSNEGEDYGGTSKGWLRPVSGGHISTRFHQIDKVHKKPHAGLDYAVNMNTPVKAAYKGKVVLVGQDGGYGNVVRINHGKIDGKTVVSQYSHLNKFGSVYEGKFVNTGELIAYVGSTGYSTGPHLDFTIRENGVIVNPGKYVGNN